MISKTLTSNNFIQDETTGIYIATILASTHQMGTAVTVVKMLRRDSNNNHHSAIPTFSVEANGDVKIYVDEPGVYRITLMDTTSTETA